MPSTPSVQSLHRGLQILRLLARTEGGLGVGGAAVALGVKPPTAHALLQTLVADRFASKRGPRYFLGGEALALHSCHTEQRLQAGLASAVQSLARRIPDCTVTFAAPRHEDVAVLYRADSSTPATVEQPVGRSLPLYNSISGLVLMAHAEPELREALTRRYPFPETGIQLWKTREALDAQLACIARDHLGVFPFDDVATVRAAVPVIRKPEGLVGVMGVYARNLPTAAARDAVLAKLGRVVDDLLSGDANQAN